MKNLLNFWLTILLSIFSGNVVAQISPGDLSQPHAYIEGVENCTKCHDAGNRVTNKKCLDCHTEIKAKIIAGRGYHASSEVKKKQCSACHNEHHGRKFQLIRFDKKKFNHVLTGFKLEGAHAKQSCENCHNAEHIKDPKIRKKAGTYLGLNTTCTSCHNDYHQGKLSSNCASCHNMNSFENAKPFNHSKTKFPLLGKHKPLKCQECHKVVTVNGQKKQNFAGLKFANCNACHKDHHNNRFGQNCKQCHTETSFKVIKGVDSFNHDKTDFPLVGKHKLVACKKCHTSGKMTTPIKFAQCTDCHKDYHEGQFTEQGKTRDCSQCHSIYGFKPSEYSIDKHNTSQYPLKGAHIATACTECHLKGEHWEFRKIGEKCVDCHENIHKGKIEENYMPAEDCSICHNEANWHQVTFDHNQTDFKLTGEHAKTDCNECHFKKDETGKEIQQFNGLSKACSTCHQDKHGGQFEINGITDCQRCHTTSDWEKTNFNHDTARFKLDGKHATVKCEACHKPVTTTKGTFIQHRFTDISCAACHSN